MAKDPYELVSSDFSDFVGRMIDLSILSCYSKDSQFRPEAEWRHIIHRHDVVGPIHYDKEHSCEYILESVPGRIVQIITRMKKSESDIFEESIPEHINLIRQDLD